MKKTQKTDPNLVALIAELKRETREGDAAIWRDIAQRLEKPSRNWAEVNLEQAGEVCKRWRYHFSTWKSPGCWKD